jgi:hypothetical protein
MNDLDQRMIRELRPMLREMRDEDPTRYRKLFSTLIPQDALPSEVYSDRQLEVIYGAVCRGLARRAARVAATLH